MKINLYVSMTEHSGYIICYIFVLPMFLQMNEF